MGIRKSLLAYLATVPRGPVDVDAAARELRCTRRQVFAALAQLSRHPENQILNAAVGVYVIGAVVPMGPSFELERQWGIHLPTQATEGRVIRQPMPGPNDQDED